MFVLIFKVCIQTFMLEFSCCFRKLMSLVNSLEMCSDHFEIFLYGSSKLEQDLHLYLYISSSIIKHTILITCKCWYPSTTIYIYLTVNGKISLPGATTHTSMLSTYILTLLLALIIGAVFSNNIFKENTFQIYFYI